MKELGKSLASSDAKPLIDAVDKPATVQESLLLMNVLGSLNKSNLMDPINQ